MMLPDGFLEWLIAVVLAATGMVAEVNEPATVNEGAVRGEQVQVTEPPPPPESPHPPHYDTWLRIAVCESNSRWDINTGNSYYGGLQFNLTTWRAAGGTQFAPYPHQATMLEQMWAAERVLELRAGWGMSGWQAWPACTRKLGIGP